MNENVKAAFVAAGAISASDCMKLHTVTAGDPGEQVAAFKAAHPCLFHQAPMFNARTAPRAMVNAALADLRREEQRRCQAIDQQRAMERIQQAIEIPRAAGASMGPSASRQS